MHNTCTQYSAIVKFQCLCNVSVIVRDRGKAILAHLEVSHFYPNESCGLVLSIA